MNLFEQNATEILLLIFLTVTFLQSGLDKVLDWKGNIEWLKGHFSETIFKNIVPFLLSIVLFMEVLVGILSIFGVYRIIAKQDTTSGFYGAILGGVTLLMLLLGQRIAKDYEGARTIVVYLIPTVFLIFLLQN